MTHASAQLSLPSFKRRPSSAPTLPRRKTLGIRPFTEGFLWGEDAALHPMLSTFAAEPLVALPIRALELPAPDEDAAKAKLSRATLPSEFLPGENAARASKGMHHDASSCQPCTA